MGLNILTVDGSSVVHQRLSNLQITSEMNTFQGVGHDLVSDTARWNFILDRSKLFLYARMGGGPSRIIEPVHANVRFFPNPTTDWLQIDGTSPALAIDAPWTYALLDLSGRWVRTFSPLSQDGRIYLGDLSSGQYLLSLRQQDQTSYHRIIKK